MSTKLLTFSERVASMFWADRNLGLKKEGKMKYNVEPMWITGANAFGRTEAEVSGVELEGVERDRLEEILRSLPSLSGFALTTVLTIPLEARVLRNFKPGREIVRLASGGKSVDLTRDVFGNPGDIGVSCNRDGAEVPVITINIRFRDVNDVFTDRGIVWVYPSRSHATMNFFIKAQALKIPGLVAQIVTAAEEAVKTKVLDRFQ